MTNMSANIIVLILIFFSLFVTTIIFYEMLDISSYIIIGGVTGLIAVSITIFSVILCHRKHKNAISNENGFKIHTSESNMSTPEIRGLESSPNTYVKTNEIVKSKEATKNNETITSTCPTSTTPNGPQQSMERKNSIASDYTESHYYTEIDEYYLNKRKEKQIEKLQHRYDNEAFEEDDTFPYDYAYGINSHK